jgi:hypothetical protein
VRVFNLNENAHNYVKICNSSSKAKKAESSRVLMYDFFLIYYIFIFIVFTLNEIFKDMEMTI